MATEAELGRRCAISRRIVFAQFLKSFDAVRRIENGSCYCSFHDFHRWMESLVIIKFGWEYPPVVILMRGRSLFALLIVFVSQLIFNYQDDDSLKAALTGTTVISKHSSASHLFLLLYFHNCR